MQHQQQLEWEEEDRAERGIQAIVRMGTQASINPTFVSPLPLSPPVPATGKAKGKQTAAAAAIGGGSGEA
jgi:hypothetical protein